jgi:hypothetical protein
MQEPGTSGEPGASDHSRPSSRGFFPMDRISLAMLAAGLGVLALAYVPVLLDPAATLMGYPWMFAVKPPLGLILGGAFVAATYWLDPVDPGEEDQAEGRRDPHHD